MLLRRHLRSASAVGAAHIVAGAGRHKHRESDRRHDGTSAIVKPGFVRLASVPLGALFGCIRNAKPILRSMIPRRAAKTAARHAVGQTTGTLRRSDLPGGAFDAGGAGQVLRTAAGQFGLPGGAVATEAGGGWGRDIIGRAKPRAAAIRIRRRRPRTAARAVGLRRQAGRTALIMVRNARAGRATAIRPRVEGRVARTPGYERLLWRTGAVLQRHLPGRTTSPRIYQDRRQARVLESERRRNLTGRAAGPRRKRIGWRT